MAAIVNLQYLKRSYRKPGAGDVFVMQVPDKRFLFGRVIISEAPREFAPMPMSNLLYIYNWTSAAETPDYSRLTPDDLLIPPVWTNRKGWTMGVFKTVDSRTNAKADLLRVYCFRDSVPRFGAEYVDERWQRLARRVEPCGEWGLASYRWIDDRISEALGIPLAPADDG